MKAGSVTLTKSIDLKAFRTQFSEIYFQATLESQSGFFYDKSNSFFIQLYTQRPGFYDFIDFNIIRL